MATIFPITDDLVNQAKKVFLEEFNTKPTVAVSAPGRVNLIGEHIDYNDGFVLPIALPLVTVIVGKAIEGDESVIVTTNQDVSGPHKCTIKMPNKKVLIDTSTPEIPKWGNYIKGVIVNYFGDAPAFEAVITSSVPTGSGLSSSAALEVATYTFLDALSGLNDVMPTDKALACQKAEHDYAGVPCGIMDQFTSVMGKEGHALLIDCRDFTLKLIPFSDKNISILVTNSHVSHELANSEYSTRRKQCEQAALLLKKLSLRDASIEDINYLKSINAEEELIKRAKHVITEIERTLNAAEALKEKNFTKLGDLMVESHYSLRDDYEVSCSEIDNLVELALQVDGVLGSRITGGGFGGCTVTLVYTHAVNEVINHIKTNFSGNVTFYICQASTGAQILLK